MGVEVEIWMCAGVVVGRLVEWSGDRIEFGIERKKIEGEKG